MDASLQELGPRLRSARKKRGLTLEELADRSGISTSTLSRLESGKRQATLELLVPLTRQLQIRIDDLVPAEPADPRIRQSEVHRHGLFVVPLAPSHAPIQTYKITYPPVTTMPSLRTHDGYEWLYVLQGRLRIQLGTREFVRNRGEAAEFDTRTPHASGATGGRSCQVISIFNEDGARIHTRGVA